jgi:hypothetical protein
LTLQHSPVMSLYSTTQSCYVTLQYNTVLLCHLTVQHIPVMSLYSTTQSCCVTLQYNTPVVSLYSTTQSCYITLQYNTVLLCHLTVKHSPVMSLYSTTQSCFFRRLVSDISNVFRVSIFKVNKSSVILLGPFDPEDEGIDTSKRR